MAAVALATAPHPEKLRVGLFADCALQPRWVVEAFAKVAASDFAQIVLICSADAPLRRVPWLFRSEDRDAPVDLARYVPHQRLRKMGSAPFLELDLDVAFALGDFDDSALDGIARLGVWRFYADGLREVVEGAPLTGSGLQVRLAPGAAPRIAYQSWSRSEPLSIARNRDRLLAKTSEFAYRALRDAQRFGHGWLEQCKALSQIQGRTTVSPLSALGSVMRNRGLSLVSSLLHTEQRFIALRRGNGSISANLDGFTRLPGDWRTPFPVRECAFFEDAGRIAVIQIGPDGAWTPPATVLEGRHPFIVEEDGGLYLATSENLGVRLYRCIEFPLRWRLERVLLEGLRCVDATFHRAAERWWMFAAGKFDEELDLYHAPRLFGPWQPHPRNPVKSDARCARPAGRLYWRNGALYRPAQICVPHEGAGVSINRVLRLTPHDYAERQVERILGVRSVSHAAELTVIDAFARRRRFA